MQTENRPKLLFLAQVLPYPPDGGVQIRTYNILKLLAQSFDVTALCFYRKKVLKSPGAVAASVQALGGIAQVEAFDIPQEHSSLRFLGDHLQSTLKQRAYTVHAYKSKAFRQRLQHLLSTQTFDLVHADSLDLSGYFPMISGTPIVCVHHNVESLLLRRRAENEKNPATSKYIRYQAGLMEAEERYWCPRVALNVVVSDQDRMNLQQIAPAARLQVIPNGVDTAFFQPDPGPEDGIVFVGGYTWYPNRDALEFFADQILPKIRARVPNTRITWVGRAPESVQQHYRSEYGIEMTGYVDDIRPLVHRAACYVAPLRVGGGTRLKILDAWAMGKAVVSTSVGCEGLDSRHAENILIHDDPDDFADAVVRVLHDRTLRVKLGTQARMTAASLYEWQVIGRSVAQCYLRLVEAMQGELQQQRNGSGLHC